MLLTLFLEILPEIIKIQRNIIEVASRTHRFSSRPGEQRGTW